MQRSLSSGAVSSVTAFPQACGALGTGCALSLQQAGGETRWLNQKPASVCQLRTVAVRFTHAHFHLCFCLSVESGKRLSFARCSRLEGSSGLPSPRPWWHHRGGTAPLLSLSFHSCLIQQQIRPCGCVVRPGWRAQVAEHRQCLQPRMWRVLQPRCLHTLLPPGQPWGAAVGSGTLNHEQC